MTNERYVLAAWLDQEAVGQKVQGPGYRMTQLWQDIAGG